MELLTLSEMTLIRLLQVMNNSDEIMLRSYVSVLDLQFWTDDGSSKAGSTRIHGDPERTFEPRHGRTAQVAARHFDKRTRTADHRTKAKRSTGIPRSCSKVQSAFASPVPGTAIRDHAF